MKKHIIHDFFKKSEQQEGFLYVCKTKNGHPKFKSAKTIVKKDGSTDVVVNDPQPIFLKYGRTKYLANRMRMYGDGYELIHSVSYIQQIKELTGLRNNDEHIQITDLDKRIEGDLEWPCWKLKNENDIIELVNHYAFGEIKLEQRQDEYVIDFEKENKTNQDDLTIGSVWHASILSKFLS